MLQIRTLRGKSFQKTYISPNGFLRNENPPDLLSCLLGVYLQNITSSALLSKPNAKTIPHRIKPKLNSRQYPKKKQNVVFPKETQFLNFFTTFYPEFYLYLQSSSMSSSSSNNSCHCQINVPICEVESTNELIRAYSHYQVINELELFNIATKENTNFQRQLALC